MSKKREDAINTYTRCLVIIITLLAVCYLAILGNEQIAPLAAGALFTMLAGAMGYEFRGRVEAPTTDVTPAAGERIAAERPHGEPIAGGRVT